MKYRLAVVVELQALADGVPTQEAMRTVDVALAINSLVAGCELSDKILAMVKAEVDGRTA